jgi:iron complex outermembrane recepter protein
VTQSNTYSTNLDLTGHFDTFGLKHTFLLGGDYYRLNNSHTVKMNFDLQKWTVVDINNPVNPGLPIDTSGDASFYGQQQTDQYGLYAQDQIKLPYDVHVTGGIRYQNIHQKIMQGVVGFESTAIQSQDAVTPRVGILWHPQSWISRVGWVACFSQPNSLVRKCWVNGKAVNPTYSNPMASGILTTQSAPQSGVNMPC